MDHPPYNIIYVNTQYVHICIRIYTRHVKLNLIFDNQMCVYTIPLEGGYNGGTILYITTITTVTKGNENV